MSARTPVTELHPSFSTPDVEPTSWEEGQAALEQAEIFWISTVRPDGRPHVTPLVAAWHAGALYFCTGPEERKGRNLAENPQVVLTTGSSSFNDGLDLIVEGAAIRVTDEALLQRLAEIWVSKYDWRFEVRDGAFHQEGVGAAHVFEVAPTTIFGFGRNEGFSFSQTRWRF
jgi:general stress protein 26